MKLKNLTNAVGAAMMSGVVLYCAVPLPVQASPTMILSASATLLTGTAPAIAKAYNPDISRLIQKAPNEVGYLPGAWSVTPSGNFTYKVDLDVPAGRMGMQPNLALTYSSNTSQGLLGVGWSLSGFSSISRCAKNLAQDGVTAGIEYNSEDKFCLDGVGLVLVSGTSGETGASYRTRDDSNAIISIPIAHANGPDQFQIRMPDGRLKVYSYEAQPERARVRMESTDGVPGRSYTDTSLGETNALWLLTAEEDLYGNRVSYDYDVEIDSAFPSSERSNRVSYVPKSITYSSVGGVDYRKIEFIYDELADISKNDIVSWEDGIQYAIKKRLKAIVMSAPNPVSVEEVWRYDLSYNDDLIELTDTSRLGSIQKCGAKGGCLWKKSFDWDTEAATATPKYELSSVYAPSWPSVSVPFAATLATRQVFDANGDGLDDIYLEKKPLYELATDSRLITSSVTYTKGVASSLVPLNSVNTMSFSSARKPTDNRVEGFPHFNTIDVDGDGTPELFADLPTTGSASERALLRKSSSGFSYTQVNDAAGNPVVVAPETQVLWADMNGDARPDMLIGENDSTQVFLAQNCRPNCSGPYADGYLPDMLHTSVKPYYSWAVRLTTDIGLAAPVSTGVTSMCPLSAVDLNGEGRTSFTYRAGRVEWEDRTDGYFRWEESKIHCDGDAKKISMDSAGAISVTSGTTSDGNLFFGRGRYADFNGDGLADLLDYTSYLVNTGEGYYRPHTPIDWVGGAIGYPLTIDINGDGMVDLVKPSTASTSAKVWYADRQGAFREFPVDLGFMGEGMIPGDFNGDGLVDFATFAVGSSSTTIYIHYRVSPMGARIVRVRDANAAPGKGEVAPAVIGVQYRRPVFERSYNGSTSLVDGLNTGGRPPKSCAYPLVCNLGGMTVVDMVADSTSTPEPDSNNYVTAKARHFHYLYENPLSDRTGNGFLGFGAFSIWDHEQATLTRHTFDKRHEAISMYGARVYPKAHHETDIVTLQARVTDEDFSASSMPGVLVHRHNVNTVYTKNGGKTYHTRVTGSTSREYSATVSLDTGYDWWTGRVRGSGQSLERETTADYEYHSLGYQTSSETRVTAPAIGSALTESMTLTDINAGGYHLFGLPDVVTVTATEPDGSSTTRKMDYDYNSKGQVDLLTIEPDTLDALLKHKIRYYYDDTTGVLKGIGRIGKRTASGTDIEQLTRFEYDSLLGEPAEAIYPSQIWQQNGNASSGHLSTWTAMHPAYGVPVMSMDANGVMTSAEYDDLGRLILQKQDGILDTRFTYEARQWAGDIIAGVTVTGTVGSQWRKAYLNASGQAVKSQWPGFDGTTVTAESIFDVLGRQQKVTHPYTTTPSLATTYDYDSLGRTLVIDGPGAGSKRCTYTYFVAECLDENDHLSRTEHDINGRLELSVNHTDEHGDIATEYRYHPFDLLKSVSDPDDHVTTYEYDLLGRMTKVTRPDAGITNSYYNGLGELWKIERPALLSSDPADTYTELFVRDNFGRVTSATSPDGVSTFQYDSATNGIGKLDYAISPFNVRSQNYYNSNGQLSGVDTTLNYGGAGETTYQVGMTYTSKGMLSQLAYPNATGRTRFTLKHTYNGAGYLTAVSDASPSVTAAKLWSVTSRNANSALLEGFLGDTVPGSIAANGQIKLTRSYETATGRLDVMRAEVAGAARMNIDYGYYDNGQVHTRNDGVELRNETYSYDGVGRLKNWSLAIGGTTRPWLYGYSADGNLNTVTSDTTLETFTYETTKPHAVKRQARQVRVGGGWGTAVNRDYSYDSRGRRKELSTGSDTLSYSFFDLPKTVGGKSFVYDAFGNRVQKILSEGVSTVYIMGLYEKRKNGGVEEHIYHVNGGDGAQADVVFNNAVTPKTKVEYQLKDRLGSTGVVLNGTGTLGSVLQRLYFDPFGKRITSSGADFASSLTSHDKTGLTGHEYDDELGLVNMRGRMYDARTKRFLTADPLAKTGFGQSWNSYSYVWNDPANLTDPSGFMPPPGTCETEQTDNGSITRCNDNGSSTVTGGEGASPADYARVEGESRFRSGGSGPMSDGSIGGDGHQGMKLPEKSSANESGGGGYGGERADAKRPAGGNSEVEGLDELRLFKTLSAVGKQLQTAADLVEKNAVYAAGAVDSPRKYKVVRPTSKLLPRVKSNGHRVVNDPHLNAKIGMRLGTIEVKNAVKADKLRAVGNVAKVVGGVGKILESAESGSVEKYVGGSADIIDVLATTASMNKAAGVGSIVSGMADVVGAIRSEKKNDDAMLDAVSEGVKGLASVVSGGATIAGPAGAVIGAGAEAFEAGFQLGEYIGMGLDLYFNRPHFEPAEP